MPLIYLARGERSGGCGQTRASADIGRLPSDCSTGDLDYVAFRGVPAPALAARLRKLKDDPIAGEVTEEALAYLQDLFSNVRSPGSQMAGRAAAPLEDPDTIAASCAALTQDLLKALGR